VLAGAVSHPLQAAPEFLTLHDQLIAAAPDELSTAVSLALDPTGRPVVTVALCWCGPHDHGYTILEPLRSYGRPILNQVEPTPYADWQRGPDAGFPPGRLHYWKAGWLRDLTDATITTLVDRLQTMPSSFSGIGLQRMGGAAARIAPAATAFAHRAEQYDMLILSQWADRADSERTSPGPGKHSQRCSPTWPTPCTSTTWAKKAKPACKPPTGPTTSGSLR
jgi:hypothetical protein